MCKEPGLFFEFVNFEKVKEDVIMKSGLKFAVVLSVSQSCTTVLLECWD